MASAKQRAWRAKFARLYGKRKGTKARSVNSMGKKKGKKSSGFRGFNMGGIGSHLDKAAKGMGYVDLAVMAGNLIAPEQTAQLNTPMVRTAVAYFKGNIQGAAAEAYRSGLVGGFLGGQSSSGGY